MIFFSKSKKRSYWAYPLAEAGRASVSGNMSQGYGFVRYWLAL
jgi:hypothetical protein